MTDLTCPFLGLSDDPETLKLFPSEQNCCQRAQPVEAVALTHQAAYCLSAQHYRCPVFAGKVIGRLPPHLSASPRRPGNWRWAAVSLTAFALAIVLGFVGWQSGLPALPPPVDTWTPIPPIVSSPTPEAPTSLPTDTPVPLLPSDTPEPLPQAPEETSVPEPTEQPASTPTASACNTPSGWVIYTVQTGDTLFGLSVYFGVTQANLQQANCLGNNTQVYIGQRLYVPNVPTPTLASPTATLHAPTETATVTATLQPPTNTPVTPSITPSSTPKPLPTDTTQPTDTLPPPTETRDIPPPNP